MIDYAAPPQPAISPKRLTQVQRRWLVALGWPLACGVTALTVHFPWLMTIGLGLGMVAVGTLPKQVRWAWVPLLRVVARQGLTVLLLGLPVFLGLVALGWFDGKGLFDRVIGAYWFGAGSTAVLAGLGLMATARERVVVVWRRHRWVRWLVPGLVLTAAGVAMISAVLYLVVVFVSPFAVALVAAVWFWDGETNDDQDLVDNRIDPNLICCSALHFNPVTDPDLTYYSAFHFNPVTGPDRADPDQ